MNRIITSIRNGKAIFGATVIAAAVCLIAAPISAHEADLAAERVAATTVLTESVNMKHEQLGVYAVAAKVRADSEAEAVITEATQVIAAVSTKIDAGHLSSSVASLASYKKLDFAAVKDLTEKTATATATATAAAAEVDRLAAEAAAAAAAAAAEAQRIADETLRASNTPEGARAAARHIAATKYGWGDDQFSCLNQLWQKESGWNVAAYNSGSGATGIPQSLPGSKMASAGADWATSAATQITWGLGYISGRYGSPCSAMAHSASVNWY